MKQLITLLFVTFLSLSPIDTMAQENASTTETELQDGPIIKFEKRNHNFGKILHKDGRVSHEFVFTNEGNAPLIIHKTKGSCGCTASKPPKHPIMPGEEASIKVTFNPKGKSGRQHKTVTITHNSGVPDQSKTTKISISAHIVSAK